MSSVGLLDPSDEPLWDRFVENHPHGWVCHLSAWKKVLEESFPHIRCRNHLVKWNEDKTRIVGGLPLYDVKSYLLGNRLVSIPYATLSDPLFETQDDLAELLDEAIAIYRRGRYRYIEIRSYKSSSVFYQQFLYPSECFKNHFICLDDSLENIRKSFHLNVKRSLRKGENNGFYLKYARNKQDVDAFYEMYVNTRKTLGLPPHPHRFFKNIWDVLYPLQLLSVPLVLKDNQLAAGMILLNFKDRVSVEYAAWNRKFAKECPNHLLFWEAIKMAYNKNFKVFDFGRTTIDNNSLMLFKSRWGTQVADLLQYQYSDPDVFSRERCAIKGQGLIFLKAFVENSPSMLCRWIGEYCYRHLG